MHIPEDVDPAIGEHVVAIRNRWGLPGLRDAAELITSEIAIFEDAAVKAAQELNEPLETPAEQSRA